ncbi:hypothetical protein DF17_16550 [Streptomyces rimosus]|nr:hypothetical protein DF17_16550 [Streptomyces rimosus]
MDRLAGFSGSSGSAAIANFVASTTSSRWARMNGPMNSSLCPTPYMSAVSKSVTPSSSARSSVARASSSSFVGP